MRRITRPPALLLLCLVTWLALGPAALRTLDLNLTHLALRAWNPLAAPLPAGSPGTPPGCADSPDASAPGPCARAAALAWLAGAAGDGPAQAVRLLDRPATRHPLDLYFLGLAEERAGNRPAAWRAWARIGAEDRILARGTELARQGEYPAAGQEFSAILDVLPENAGAYVARGRVAAAQDRWADALRDYRQAVAYGGGAVAQTELGTALWYANHDLAAARTALEAGWTAQPTAWAGWTWARVLLAAGDRDGALAAAETARHRFPGDPDLTAVYQAALAARSTPGAAP